MFKKASFRSLFAWLLLFAAGSLAAFQGAGAAVQSLGSAVHVLSVKGVIGPASSDYVLRGLERAADESALVIIELDTPGGLDPSMRSIVQAILASPVPVVTFVSPGGARAASAGTFILYASHLAAMTPASNLGAASPVAIGVGGASDPDKTGSDRSPESKDTDVMAGKVKNDAAAYIRGLAQLRGRNVEFAERAVRDAQSLSAQEALEQGVIEFVATDVSALLKQLDGVELAVGDGATVRLDTAAATVQRYAPDWRNRMLSLITNPQLAIVLMMIGIYGLFFELTSPGFALPGVAGLICLVLGLYAFHLLPVNWAGLALLLAGAAMMIGEVFLPSFGVLGIGGIIAFVLGGLFLTDTGIPGFDLSLPFLIGLAVSSAMLLLVAGTLATRAYRQGVVTGKEAMMGLQGIVRKIDGALVYAEIRGEHWQVVADETLSPGDHVRVIAVRGLTLQVVRVAADRPGPQSTKG